MKADPARRFDVNGSMTGDAVDVYPCLHVKQPGEHKCRKCVQVERRRVLDVVDRWRRASSPTVQRLTESLVRELEEIQL